MKRYKVTVDNGASWDIIIEPWKKGIYRKFIEEYCGLDIKSYELVKTDNTYKNGVAFTDLMFNENKIILAHDLLAIELDHLYVVDMYGLWFEPLKGEIYGLKKEVNA